MSARLSKTVFLLALLSVGWIFPPSGLMAQDTSLVAESRKFVLFSDTSLRIYPSYSTGGKAFNPGSLGFVKVTEPAHGTLVYSETAKFFTYTPQPGYIGMDNFSWKFTCNLGESNIAPCQFLMRKINGHAGELVLLIVNSNIQSEIESDINRLALDLQQEGYSARIKSWTTDNWSLGMAEDIWKYLRMEYDSMNQYLIGAILIGNLDIPKGESPTDLYYWNMQNYITSATSYHRDIWVSRISANYILGGPEVKMIKRYLQANHDYRKGFSRLPHTAYFYDEIGPPWGGKTQNALEVWPVVKELYPVINCFRAGGESLHETSHGGSGDAYDKGGNPSVNIRSIHDYLAQVRVSLNTSCSDGGFGGIVNNQLFTRRGGNILSVGMTTDGYAGGIVMLDSNYVDSCFRSQLVRGNSWGAALIDNYPFTDYTRLIFHGDLSLPVKLFPANAMPVLDTLFADKTSGTAPLTVTFTSAARDTDGSITTYEWFMKGHNYGRSEPDFITAAPLPQSHTYTLPHRYLVRVQAVDNYQAVVWKDMEIAVGPQPNTPLRVQCGTSPAYDNSRDYYEPDYLDHSGSLWLHDQGYVDGTWGSKTTGEGAGEMSESDVEGTEEDTLYKWFRTTCCSYYENGLPPVVYAVPLENGIYTLNIGLADMLSSNAGERVMDVIVENDTIRKALDVYSMAGPKTAYVVSTKVEVKDGMLEFSLAKNPLGTEAPFINCFEVIPESWINRTSQLSVSSLSYGVQAFPNPFAGAASIKFSVPQTKNGERQSLSVRVYDLNGQLVRTLAQGQFAAGYHTVQLNARDKGKGYALSNGIYFCRMQAPGFTKTLKLLLVE